MSLTGLFFHSLSSFSYVFGFFLHKLVDHFLTSRKQGVCVAGGHSFPIHPLKNGNICGTASTLPWGIAFGTVTFDGGNKLFLHNFFLEGPFCHYMVFKG